LEKAIKMISSWLLKEFTLFIYYQLALWLGIWHDILVEDAMVYSYVVVAN